MEREKEGVRERRKVKKLAGEEKDVKSRRRRA